MMIIHATTYGRRLITHSSSSKTYITRYREEDGAVHEACLKIDWFGGITLLEDKRRPSRLARGMENIHLPMHCWDCGTTMPAGAKRCPYCKVWRGTFKEG